MKIDKNDLFNRNMQKPLKSILFSWNDLVISEETGNFFQANSKQGCVGTHLR